MSVKNGRGVSLVSLSAFMLMLVTGPCTTTTTVKVVMEVKVREMGEVAATSDDSVAVA